MLLPTPIQGIKSVDFKVEAEGYGVVNWNGSTAVSNNGSEVKNHLMPKLRGYTNLSGKQKEDTGYKYKKDIQEIDFKKNPLYISQNCIRHHLFKEHSFDGHFVTKKNTDKLLVSTTGLLRGYAVPSESFKKESPLLIEDFVDSLGNGNFEQMTRCGERNNTSIFSKITFGETKYTAYGSISIEQLQFISLDTKFDRQAIQVKAGGGEKLAEQLTEFLKGIDSSKNPTATFHENYVRMGVIFEEGEAGILLNDDAITILVNVMLEKIKNLVIRQAKGYMYTTSVVVDYNDSGRMMRIKQDEGSICEEKLSEFATYFAQK